MSELGIDDIQFLHNNAYSVENYIIAGSRGWYIDENNKNAPDAADFDKIVAREVIRLEISLKEAVKLRGDTDREIIVFLHFPPVMGGFVCEPIVELLKKYGIKRCYYGHIHGVYDIPPSFEYEGITYFITSADFLEFTPLIIR
jgi:predicted phosphohydrolase